MLINGSKDGLLSLFYHKPAVIDEIVKNLEHYSYKSMSGKSEFNDLKAYFENLYNNFRDNKIISYNIMKELDVRACPYCNLNYTDAVIREEDKKKNGKKTYIVRAHFDHYYPKSIYPMFALSFYNLIPSCYECNSSLKGEKIDIENMPLNPYESDFDSLAKFVITFSPNAENIPNYSDINSFNIKIIANQQNKLVKNHCDFFELEERYRYRKLEASEILMKKFIDTPKMRREIANQLCLNNIPSSYMNLLLYGNYISSDMINKRPLSKLTQDIFNMKNLIIKK